MENLRNQFNEEIDAILDGCELSQLGMCSDFDINDSIDSIQDYILDRIREREVIYYSVAIKYLQENDPSLNESLSIASELGFTVENLNSEVLATLLRQRELEEELFNCIEEIEEVLEEFQARMLDNE